MNHTRVVISLSLSLVLLLIAPTRFLMGAAEPFYYGHQSTQKPITPQTRTTVVPSWLMNPAQATQPQNTYWWQQGNFISPRKNFVYDLIGMPEDTFRHLMSWPYHQPFDPTKVPSHRWVTDWKDFQGQYRRAAVFQGTLISKRVQNWKTDAANRLSIKGYFSIHFDDPSLPWESDIRYLQSIPEHKYAAFQIASTPFGPLEGGMTDYDAKLTEMFPHAAQGEEASAATAGATFYRKYCMPHYIYLFAHVNNLPMYKHKMRGRMQIAVDANALKSYRYNKNDENNVIVVAHDEIAVTGGYGPYEGKNKMGPQRGDNPEQRLTVYTDQFGKVDTSKTQIVTHLFTSAINLSRSLQQSGNSGVTQAAKMALNASYAGTIAAAQALGKPRLFLTLMGGGAFRNNIDWIAEAIEHSDIPKAANDGMKISLMYRPDTRFRSTHEDYNFLMRMVKIFDQANGTSLASDKRVQSDIFNYVNSCYLNDPTACHFAKQLNDRFMRAVINR